MTKSTSSTTGLSRRILPPDWLYPSDYRAFFPDPGAPLILDVGCGKGHFLLTRAARHPGENYLGIERQLRRLRTVDRKAVHRGIENIRLLRLDAYYAVTRLLPPACIRTCYILFPDPWPKKKHHRNRFMGPAFLEALHRCLIPGGTFHFATDHLPYYASVLELLIGDSRFVRLPAWRPAPDERTEFERLFLDRKPIGRASFQRPDDAPPPR